MTNHTGFRVSSYGGFRAFVVHDRDEAIAEAQTIARSTQVPAQIAVSDGSKLVVWPAGDIDEYAPVR